MSRQRRRLWIRQRLVSPLETVLAIGWIVVALITGLARSQWAIYNAACSAENEARRDDEGAADAANAALSKVGATCSGGFGLLVMAILSIVVWIGARLQLVVALRRNAGKAARYASAAAGQAPVLTPAAAEAATPGKSKQKSKGKTKQAPPPPPPPPPVVEAPKGKSSKDRGKGKAKGKEKSPAIPPPVEPAVAGPSSPDRGRKGKGKDMGNGSKKGVEKTTKSDKKKDGQAESKRSKSKTPKK